METAEFLLPHLSEENSNWLSGLGESVAAVSGQLCLGITGILEPWATRYQWELKRHSDILITLHPPESRVEDLYLICFFNYYYRQLFIVYYGKEVGNGKMHANKWSHFITDSRWIKQGWDVSLTISIVQCEWVKHSRCLLVSIFPFLVCGFKQCFCVLLSIKKLASEKHLKLDLICFKFALCIFFISLTWFCLRAPPSRGISNKKKS